MLNKREVLSGAAAAAFGAVVPAAAIEALQPNPYEAMSSELLLNLLRFARNVTEPAEFLVTGGQDVMALIELDRQGKLPPLKMFDFRHEGDKTFRIRLISAAFEGELPELWSQPEEVAHG
jgi:hypothetical protein